MTLTENPKNFVSQYYFYDNFLLQNEKHCLISVITKVFFAVLFSQEFKIPHDFEFLELVTDL